MSPGETKNNGARAKGGGLKRAKEVLSGRKALVVGLAATGVSSARFLKKCGAAVTATDMKPLAELPEAQGLEEAGVVIVAGGHDGVALTGEELVVVSPGVPYGHALLEEAREKGAEVISDIELAYRFMDAPVLAVAGTNGKTTTTTLLGKVLEDAGRSVFVGGNIGTPAIEYVENEGKADYCVLEISSFHLETTDTFTPHVGILLNITEDHLDRYRDFTHYAGTKFRLFENQKQGDFAVVNVNDPVIAKKALTGFGGGKTVPFTVWGALNEGLYYTGKEIVYRGAKGAEEVYQVKDFKLKGLHNIENIMAVIAASRIVGVPREAILKTLSGFKGLHHRMEFVRELDGVTYIDDSKGTNVGALVMALKGTDAPVVLIAGGKDKGGDYGVLSDLVKEKVRLLVLLGEARFRIKEALQALTETVVAGSLEEAVKVARERAQDGDTVLLCPACSSFDMFKSYKERGELFKAFVEAL
ncbi:MAG: UDP-N-acetylmuramoyl-L-alanine--D-glutamate ligase [Deltaproteobacteria bacterium]|nr:UDP-N-acetylmuramoyl-L-alanine--D-glutamate ligase [Deltaproteobacteria bacterium]